MAATWWASLRGGVDGGRGWCDRPPQRCTYDGSPCECRSESCLAITPPSAPRGTASPTATSVTSSSMSTGIGAGTLAREIGFCVAGSLSSFMTGPMLATLPRRASSPYGWRSSLGGDGRPLRPCGRHRLASSGRLGEGSRTRRGDWLGFGGAGPDDRSRYRFGVLAGQLAAPSRALGCATRPSAAGRRYRATAGVAERRACGLNRSTSGRQAPACPPTQLISGGGRRCQGQAVRPERSEPRSGGLDCRPAAGATPVREARIANAVNRYLSACALMACLPLGLCRE